MAAIRYRHIYSYSCDQEANSIHTLFENNNIAHTRLTYNSEQKPNVLLALSTWFDDDAGGKVQFSDFPIIIYEEVLWESADKNDIYEKRRYSFTADTLPADFIIYADKNI